jgi:hypothetical protein
MHRATHCKLSHSYGTRLAGRLSSASSNALASWRSAVSKPKMENNGAVHLSYEQGKISFNPSLTASRLAAWRRGAPALDFLYQL